MTTRNLPLAAALALAAAAPTSHACNARKTSAPRIARVQQLAPTKWRVCFPGYVTTLTPNGISFCAVGLATPASGPITSVDALSVYKTANSESLTRYDFRPDAKVAANFKAVQDGAWAGFFGFVSGPIPAGIEHMLCFDLTVGSGTTFTSLEAALQKSTVGADESNAVRSLRGTIRSLVTPVTVTLDTCSHNAKLFYNTAHTTTATRIKGTTPNYVYSMQPQMFRNGQGAATGWRGVLQDEDVATVETVNMGFVKYAANGLHPDLSPTGTITDVQFKVFGAGSGQGASLFTFTTATKMPLARYAGIRLVLGKPRSWPSDGLTVHLQEGTTSKVPADQRKHLIWGRNNVTPLPWFAPGTTLYMAGLYDAPLSQLLVQSAAYGRTENLGALESLYPDAARGDGVIVRVEAQSHSGQFALAMTCPAYLPKPLPSPFGDFLCDVFVAFGVLRLDAAGLGITPAVPVPPGLRFATQSALLDFRDLSIRMSDAARLETR